MRLSINGETRELAATNLADLLVALDLRDAKVATALNGRFIPAGSRAGAALAEDDAIEIVSPRQGG
jgi:sulfur carrier protein